MSKAIWLMIIMLLLVYSAEIFASEVKLNNMENDYPILMIANRTQDAEKYDVTVNVNKGDKVAFRIYIHNTVVNTEAINTKVYFRCIQDANCLKTYKVSAKADNSNEISSVAQIYSDKPFQLEYIPGTTQKFYFDNGNMKNTIIPDGIVEAIDGYLIGNLKGCWEYVNYVIFQFNVK